jgi:hypothetical protein
MPAQNLPDVNLQLFAIVATGAGGRLKGIVDLYPTGGAEWKK